MVGVDELSKIYAQILGQDKVCSTGIDRLESIKDIIVRRIILSTF